MDPLVPSAEAASAFGLAVGDTWMMLLQVIARSLHRAADEQAASCADCHADGVATKTASDWQATSERVTLVLVTGGSSGQWLDPFPDCSLAVRRGDAT